MTAQYDIDILFVPTLVTGIPVPVNLVEAVGLEPTQARVW
jgi:hypothetical protein